VLLPGASLTDGKRVVERICADVHAHAHAIVDTQTIMVTCSAGLTALAELDDKEMIVTRADQALYAAKSEGRNRVALLEAAAGQPDSGTGYVMRSAC
jgi:two-component system, sensor histidine kinase LadS